MEFEEQADVNDPEHFVWSNAAYGIGVVVGRAFTVEGWDAEITSGGEGSTIESLPCYTYTDRYGDSEMMCPTEISLTVDASLILTMCGLTPLLHMKNTDRAMFAYAPSLGHGGR